jgi:hypothetical protein
MSLASKTGVRPPVLWGVLVGLPKGFTSSLPVTPQQTKTGLHRLQLLRRV